MRIDFFLLVATMLVPVMAAQYFSLESGYLTPVTRVLSTILAVWVARLVLYKIESPTLRLAASLCLYSVLGLYYSSLFVSYYTQGTYFNAQFFFHMDISTFTETWRAFLPLMLLTLVWFVVVWFLAIRNARDNATSMRPVMLLLLVGLTIGLDPGLRQSSVWAVAVLPAQMKTLELDEIDWNVLQLNPGALDDKPLSAAPGKNLVLIFLEGFDRMYTDESVFPGLTPNLNALNDSGWTLENLTQVKGSQWTMGGLVSSLCGTPLLHEWEFGGNNIMFTEFLNRVQCLPDILGKAGYTQTYMGGASLVFAGKGAFMRQHSFDSVLGRDELKPRLSDPDYLGGWGLFDDTLFDFALQEYDRLAGSGKPFNLTLLTVDTHPPAGALSKTCPRYEAIDNSILRSAHCTDYLVGQFYEALKLRESYADTVVVLIADHLAMRNNAFHLFPRKYERSLYFNALNSGRLGVSNLPAAPMDVAPTLLALLGVDHNVIFLAGEDIAQYQGSNRVVRRNHLQRNKVIGHINSTVFTQASAASGLSLELDTAGFEPRHQIVDFRRTKNGVEFRSTGDSPMLLLPLFKSRGDGPMKLIIEMDVTVRSRVRLFFKGKGDKNYHEERTREELTKLGSNQLVLPLPAGADAGRLRLQPGFREGEYVIRSVRVQY